MQNAYQFISLIWTDFPKELENCDVGYAMSDFKKRFEDTKTFFDDYLTKLVIIGNPSTGKSTLINALLKKEYFGTTTGNGTISFFYCSYSEKNYEYFTIDGGREVKEIDVLKNASKLNSHLPNFIDHNSVVKVYINDVNNKLLKRNTVIVDCPGLEHSEKYDKEIQNHCANADLFIFMLDVQHPVTPKQKEFIKTIRNNFKNPTCFFVYNKCDMINFKEEKIDKLRKEFYEIFGEQYARNLKKNGDPLYFISSKMQLENELQHSNYQGEYSNDQPDFHRLTQDILVHKDVNLIRLENILSRLSDEIKSFLKKIKDTIQLERKEKMDLRKENGELNVEPNELKEMCSDFIKFVNKVTKNGFNNNTVDKIFDDLRLVVVNHRGECTKYNAQSMIMKIADDMDSEIFDKLKRHLDKNCIKVINAQLKDTINVKLKNFNFNADIKFKIEKSRTFIPTGLNLNIFWFYESGEQGERVKNEFLKFIMMKENKNNIIQSISTFYKEQLSKIKDLSENQLKNVEKKILEYVNNLKQKENILQTLEEYEMKVLDCVRKYNSSLN